MPDILKAKDWTKTKMFASVRTPFVLILPHHFAISWRKVFSFESQKQSFRVNRSNLLPSCFLLENLELEGKSQYISNEKAGAFCYS
jgi:hypothetical protein